MPVPATSTFFDNRKYLDQLAATRASACLVAPAFAARVPEGTAALVMAAALPRVCPGAAAPLPGRHVPEGGDGATRASRRSIRARGSRRV